MFRRLAERVVPVLSLGALKRVDVEAQPDLREADRRILGDAQRAAEIEIAFRRDRGAAKRDVECRGHRLQRHAGAGDERLQQHVAGAQFQPAATGGRMQAGDACQKQAGQPFGGA